ncbi:MAG: Transcriptional regulator containing wHTH domain [Candidatus Methanohalarchaeum thermophilum]|uniref:Transcriptional regulator containing wHTH domain n=1 Tax=Methanohalarchaeum thermophilum TaxID=1903181 RepID=A0A1Q6DVY0_METT1|nr:MAG: Transcriptional regulator containing wHTH domain [Candidatus Methanohalarchaeum thermophilum]
MREKEFGREYIIEEFTRLSGEVSEETELYLIGGGAMALKGLKDATKDIDAVVTSERNFKFIRSALKDIGYRKVHDPEEKYLDLGARSMLENKDGCRFDIFLRKVADKLVFSKEMQKRSRKFKKEENTALKITSSEDIFLFKCVAGRTADIEDMNTLVQTGLDFDEIFKEIKNQNNSLGEELFITYINEALLDLEKRFGVTIPLTEKVRKVSKKVYKELDILNRVDEETRTEIEELKNKIGFEEMRFEELIEDLEQKGVIEVQNEKIHRTGKKP